MEHFKHIDKKKKKKRLTTVSIVWLWTSSAVNDGRGLENTTFEPAAVFGEDGLRGWHSREAHNTHTHTQTENQKSLYGAGTKGLFAQWPFALRWGVAGMLGPEQGHKHQTLEPSTEGGGRIHMSVCGYVGCNTQRDAEATINIFAKGNSSFSGRTLNCQSLHDSSLSDSSLISAWQNPIWLFNHFLLSQEATGPHRTLKTSSWIPLFPAD